MKKFLLGTVALIAMGTVATAADLGARPVYTKAPPIPVMNWTGFYVGGGGGYGMWDGENDASVGGVPVPGSTRTGGRGYFGTVSGGYDWQINPTWVVGVMADAQFGDIKGDITYGAALPFFQGRTKNDLNYAAGVRVGYLIAPNVLSYVNGGYSHAEFTGTNLTVFGTPTGFTTNRAKFDGWFIGGGFEHTLNIFGISAPGWFLKTEYRLAEYDRKSINAFVGPVDTLIADNFKPYVQTISTQISYKFNWGR